MDREEWLKERKKGIGGSDASAIIGVNPYKNNVKLWEEKTGRRELEDISDKPYVQYGIAMEPILRKSFAIKHPEYAIDYKENEIVKNKKYPFLFATLDGILTKETGEKGILEIKTSDVYRSRHKEQWQEQIPYNYYCQVLHYLNVTGYSFAILYAELSYGPDYQANKTYMVERDEQVEEDIKLLQEKEIEFWKYVRENKRPPLLLPEI